MLRLKAGLLVVVSVSLTAPVFCQAKESLLIGRGDLLHVIVFDNPDLEQRVRVTDAGNVTLLMGGALSVLNKTPAEAAKTVEDVLLDGHILVKPRVSIVVEEYETQTVTVIGEVKNPSTYRVNTPTSILEILAMAGGLTDVADRKILIERRGTHERVPFFLSNNAAVAAESAIQVSPGDAVIVPKADVVYILGDVGRPGGYAINDNQDQLSVLALVARAGGTNHSAVPSSAKLIHKTDQGYQTAPLPLAAIQKGKHADLQLQANDVVWVPYSYLRNIVNNGSQIGASVAAAVIYR